MTELSLHDLTVFLIAAGLVVPAARRLKVNPILGFLLVGLAVGPFGFARLAEVAPWLSLFTISNIEGVQSLAELGVIFLLFMIALELSAQRLMQMRTLVFGLGTAQILLTGLVIGAIAYYFGNSTSAAVILGGSLALSSTAIVSQHLLEQGKLATRVGQATLGVLLAQDLAVVPILFLVGALAAGADGGIVGSLFGALAQAVVVIAAIMIFGRWVVRPLFRFVNRTHSAEVVMATTLLIIAATSIASHSAGLSAALGAFLAGLILAETEFRHEIEVLIDPLKGLLLGLFFMSVAMSINLANIASDPGWIVLSIAGLILLKLVITTGLARLFELSTSESVRSGLLLAQGGEFAFVAIAAALSTGLVAQPVAQFILIVVGGTMFLTPLNIALADLVRARFSVRNQHSLDTDNEHIGQLSGHVLLVGYGRTGRMLGDLLQGLSKTFVALDLDPVRAGSAQAQGKPVYVGDASRAAMLTKVGLLRASAVVICTDDQRACARTLHAVRQLAPDLPVLVRSHSIGDGDELLRMGATLAVPEVLESGLRLGQALFEVLQLQPEAYQQALDGYRQAEYSPAHASEPPSGST